MTTAGGIEIVHKVFLFSNVDPVSRAGKDTPIAENFLTSQDHPPDQAADFPAFEGSPAAARIQITGRDFPFRGGIDFNPGLFLFWKS